MNSFNIKYIAERRKEAGVTLLIIIIGMLVLAILGVAIYTLTFTATSNQVVAQRAVRAFYLSESGIRIAAGEYKAAASTAKNSTLVNLQGSVDGRTFTMPDNSTVKIKVYPYWFYATPADEANSTSTTLYLHLSGAVPRVDDTDAAITFPGKGLLRLKDIGRAQEWIGVTTLEYDNGSAEITPGAFNAASGGTPVTFQLKNPIPIPIIATDEFYIGASYTVTQVPPNWGGDLILALDSADTNDISAKIFPPQKGSIFVASPAISQYSYDYRIITTTSSPHTVKLTNIQAIAGAATTPQSPANITSPSPIYVGKSLGFRSTSNYGD